MIERIFSPELVHALGWTLVHTLWQAAIFAIALGVLLVLLRKYSARARYNLAIGLLAVFFLTTVLTFVQLYQGPADREVMTVATSSEDVFANEVMATPSIPVTLTTREKSGSSARVSLSFRDRLVVYYNDHLPLIVTLWLMGVLVLQLRFLGQLAYIQRLKNYGTQRFPAKWAASIQELETSIGIVKSVRYLTSFRVKSPFTVGWLYPIVLFPGDLLDQLKESEIITILAHELAHVKRNDFLVNLIQTLLSSLFFYHPATWWMSARINEEREHCCDDLAIAVTGEPVGYARTLLQMKEAEVAGGSLAMAFRRSGQGGFNYRIRRLVTGYLNGATYGEGLVTALILVAALATAVAASDGEQVQQAEVNVPAIEQETFGDPLGLDKTIDHAGFGEQGVSPEDAQNRLMQDRLAVNETKAQAFVQWQSGLNLAGNSETAITLPDSLEFPFLMEAIEEGNFRLVEYFLTRQVDLNQEDQQGWTPLMVATGENHVLIVQMLISAGADVNYVNRKGWTPLMEAADEDASASALDLLAAGAKPNISGTSSTAVEVAAS